jgi:hypothetical protein
MARSLTTAAAGLSLAVAIALVGAAVEYGSPVRASPSPHSSPAGT